MMPCRMETVRDLMEEAKRRIVLLCMCVLGLAYVLSLTSSSVWINIPAAIAMISAVQYLLHEVHAKRKQACTLNMPSKVNHLQYQQLSPSNPLLQSFPSTTGWTKKVDSPVVEAALDSLTQHIVREWLTGLWYSSLTPDKDAPEELRELLNDLFGEVAMRAKHVNLIDLLTRDMVDLIRNHLELYRKAQLHIGGEILNTLTFAERDVKLKLTLISFKELHPALISSESEYKVLERLMGGVLAVIMRPDDLQCKLFQFLSRELIVCAVMRPVMNFASPGFINKFIVRSIKKEPKTDNLAGIAANETKNGKSHLFSQGTSDQLSGAQDNSQSGVELVQFGPSVMGNSAATSLNKLKESQLGDTRKSSCASKEKLNQIGDGVSNILVHGDKKLGTSTEIMEDRGELSTLKVKKFSRGDTQLEEPTRTDKCYVPEVSSRTRKGGADGWGEMLEVLSKRKCQALTPEHLDNLWTKGRHYKRREGTNTLARVSQQKPPKLYCGYNDLLRQSSISEEGCLTEVMQLDASEFQGDRLNYVTLANGNGAGKETNYFNAQNYCNNLTTNDGSDSEASSLMEEDDSSGVEGLGTPDVKVWGTISSRNASTANIRHPLESSETAHKSRRNKAHVQLRKPVQLATDNQQSRNSSFGISNWQELERKSFLQGDSLDILKNIGERSTEPVALVTEGIGSAEELNVPSDAASLTSTMSTPSSVTFKEANPIFSLASQKLQCCVLGADFVRNGTKILAVYSIFVKDSEDHTWFVKRRFRHFEELHQRLKYYSEYAVNLPQKHFLSSSTDSSFVLKRCYKLDKYMKDLLSTPGLAESVEVWDFLSVDSQTYIFRDSLSVIKTLNVDLDHGENEVNFQAGEVTEGNQGFWRLSSSDKQNCALSSIGANSVVNPVPASSVKHIISASSYEPRLGGKGTTLTTTDDDKSMRGHGNFSDTDSEEGPKLGFWSREVEESGDHEIARKLKYLEKAVASLSHDCMGGNCSTVSNSVDDDLEVPLEWIPPKLSVPLLNLVDVVFELEARGWIRRQVFWMAKQVLQLGMGDAFDDWILAKIQCLRNGEVIASAVKWLENALWPNGIFITKFRRAQLSESAKVMGDAQKVSANSTNIELQHSKSIQPQSSEQELDDFERAKTVQKLIVENAPMALVSLIGRKQYQQCAQDIYFFLQSAVFVKQLAYSFMEILILATFPELHDLVLDIKRTSM